RPISKSSGSSICRPRLEVKVRSRDASSPADSTWLCSFMMRSFSALGVRPFGDRPGRRVVRIDDHLAGTPQFVFSGPGPFENARGRRQYKRLTSPLLAMCLDGNPLGLIDRSDDPVGLQLLDHLAVRLLARDPDEDQAAEQLGGLCRIPLRPIRPL